VQKAKSVITITGMTVTADDKNRETVWYRCDLINGPFWIRNDLIQLTDPAALDQLPFVTDSEIPNPDQLPLKVVNHSTTRLLKQVGVTLLPGEVIDDDLAKKIISTLRGYSTRLSSTWKVADLQEVLSILDQLASLGVVLHSVGEGGWEVNEVRLIKSAIDKTQSATAQHFQRRFPKADDLNAVAFRLMYAPLRIVRALKDNVNPNRPDPKTGKLPTWWARNAQGFEVFLGNMVFPKREPDKSKPHKFTAEELIIHEIAHCLNFRYLPQAQRLHQLYRSKGSYTIPADETPDGKIIKTSLEAIDEGYTTRPRSSDLPAEVVTDAFTNDIVNGYKDGLKGAARRSQVSDLMQRAIEYRLQEYGPVRVRVRAETDKDLEDRLAIPLGRLDVTEATDLKTCG
jgi:hypothetical protein